MKKAYKYFGIFLISLTIILILGSLFLSIRDIAIRNRGYGQIDYVYNFATENVLFSFIVLIIGFFPGLFFYRYGSQDVKSSNLVRIALILGVISTIIMILPSYAALSCGEGCDLLGVGIMFMMFGIPALIIYCIAILLLIIYKLQSKQFKLQKTEKTALIIALIMILFVGIIYVYTMYDYASRSIEKCDKKSTQIDRDYCHYQLSNQRPNEADCEKIEKLEWKNGCYLEKASYYNDVSLCNKTSGQYYDKCMGFISDAQNFK